MNAALRVQQLHALNQYTRLAYLLNDIHDVSMMLLSVAASQEEVED